MESMVKSKKFTIVPIDENDLWDKPWTISMNDSDSEKKEIGTVSFEGEKQLGEIPIQIELKEEYRNQGIGTEVLGLMVNWAFRFADIYEISAETFRENDKARRILEKNKFVFRSGNINKEKYSIIKGKTSWLGLYLFIGFVAGIIMGLVLAHPVIGLIIGMVAGCSVGFSMDAAANARRIEVTGKKDSSRRRKGRTDKDKIEY